jgi:SAM-dependent methyltransferase
LPARSQDSGAPYAGRPWKIAVVAATVLVLELTLIRQVPAQVRIVAYFTNLLLMAAFCGLGVGCILQRRRSLAALLPAGLALVCACIQAGRGLVIHDSGSAVHFWLQYATDLPRRAFSLPLFPAAAVTFLAAATPFVALGQALARCMDAHPRLVAYSWDIAGSLLGTAIFALSSYASLPPWIWPPILMLVWAALFVRGRAARALHVLAGAAFLLFAWSSHDQRWSPYYYVQYQQQPGGLWVWVNSSFHQFAVDFHAAGAPSGSAGRDLARKFGTPYEVYRRHHGGAPPRRVLVLGAGTGNDVAVALQNEAQEIVAVEIDPAILDLGRRHNRMRPYDDPRVRTVVDDARHYLRAADERFDLIVLGTLDSQTLLSGHANLRLENYVYTREAFEDIRRRLAPGGMMAAYYSVVKPWLYGRIYATVRAAFGDATRMLPLDSDVLFNTLVLALPGDATFRDDPQTIERFAGATPATDDWPYVYVERPTIAPVYRKLCAVVLAVVAGAFLLLRRLHDERGLHANFLLLGLGFALMESAVIVRMALVFGGTWVVNAVVFAAVLLTIFLANLSVLRGAAPALRAAWIGVLACVVANYLFPLQALFELGPAARVAACAALIGGPVYCAAVCFSRLFAAERSTGFALGVNLLGAMAGGLVEYASMAIGMRKVWLVVLAVYAAAWLATTRIGRGPR